MVLEGVLKQMMETESVLNTSGHALQEPLLNAAIDVLVLQHKIFEVSRDD